MSDSNNLSEKLFSSLESPVILDDNFRVISVAFLLLTLIYQVGNEAILNLHCCIQSFLMILYQNKTKLQYFHGSL